MSAETTGEHRLQRRALAAQRREAIRAAKVNARFRRRYRKELRQGAREIAFNLSVAVFFLGGIVMLVH